MFTNNTLPRALRSEDALGQLATGKKHMFGLLSKPDKGTLLYWRHSTQPVLKLFVSLDGMSWSEQTFSCHLVLKQDNDLDEPWFFLMDSNCECIASSFDGLAHRLEVMAIITPPASTQQSSKREAQVPCGLKGLFTSSGSAVAFIQDASLCNCWLLEGEEMLRRTPPEKSTTRENTDV